MAEDHKGKTVTDRRAGNRRYNDRCTLESLTVAAVFLVVVGALLLILGPTSSDLTLPRLRVVFNNPVNIAVSAPPGAAAPAPSNASDEDIGLPQPRQLTDPPYSLGRTILDYDARRSAWLAAHPEFPARVPLAGKPRVLLVTGSAPARCPDPYGDHLLLKAFKNKADYCRVHGLDVFYNTAFLDAEMSGFWAKLPLLRTLMLAHPEVELLWWVDSDAVFTDMLFELPWERYASHNLVLHGWAAKVFEERSWVGINTGSFLIRNCQWTLDLLDAWAPMGPRGPVRDRYGELFAQELSGRPPFEADDQSALVFLLVRQRERWMDKVFLESSYELNGFWEGIVERYEEMQRKGRPDGLGDGRWPLVTHFVGCKPCRRYADSYPAERCRLGMERALNFADDQILKLYGFEHESLNGTAVRRVRNETGGPLDADDEELSRLLHPTLRAVKPT
ncbi:probable glycosyltransferase 5 [Phragmites australis]|uniref:probable glycosyltransferase 5 n=1 Tax=Phragmites australis TaxID=29695 RepID=UPI002D77DA3B|nr:probable glycosyltransferase 5 [Phragmites australis]